MSKHPVAGKKQKRLLAPPLIFLIATLFAAVFQHIALQVFIADSSWLLALPVLAGSGVALIYYVASHWQCQRTCKLHEELTALDSQLTAQQKISSHLRRKSSEAERLTATLQRQLTKQNAAASPSPQDELRFLTAFHAMPDPLIVSDFQTGDIIDVNKSLLEFTGEQEQTYTAAPISQVLRWKTADDSLRFSTDLQAAGAVTGIYAEMEDSSGTPRLMLVSAQTMEFEGNLQVLTVARDMTGQEFLRAELVQRTEVLETVLEHIPYYVFWKGLDHKYLGANSQFRTTVPDAIDPRGLSDEALGYSAADIALFHSEEEDIISNGSAFLHKERVYTFADGKKLHGTVSKLPLRSQTGDTIGILGIVADMSDMRRYESQFRMLLNGIPDPAWIKDTAGRYRITNRAFGDLCGMAAEDITGKTDFDILPPEIAANNAVADRQIITSGTATKTDEHVEIDGEAYWFEIIRQPFAELSTTGEPKLAGSMGIARDISQRKTAESEVHKLSRALDQSPTAVVITSPDGVIEYANQRYSKLTGVEEKASVGLAFPAFASAADGNSAKALWDGVQQGTPWRGEIEMTNKHSERFWLLASLSPVLADDGTVLHAVMVLEDITKRKKQEEYIRHIAMHDGLTNLPNRRLFMQRLKHAIALFHRDGVPFTIAFIDLNGFKQINDTHGHDAGDTVLAEIGKRLLHSLREVDTAARLGGDEFIALLHNLADENAIEAACKRITVGISSPIALPDTTVSVSAAIGTSSCPVHGDSPDALLSRADNAMYHHKKNAAM